MPVPSNLKPLARQSGALAMLAIDQRESMRAMFAEKQSEPVTDKQLSDFKIQALQTLTPYASAVLIDRQFAWDRAVAEKAVAPTCGMIAAMDHFIASPTEIVADVKIDEEVNPAKVKADGGVALKLLVPWRPDESAEGRLAMVADFVARCKAAGLISIIEPVSRGARDGRKFDLHEGIIAAARELGNTGADLYKAEVPLHGKGGESAVRAQCAELTKIINGPWVVLSSGVGPDEFPQAVEWACKEGASGFLAGRAVWRNTIGEKDVQKALSEDGVNRLKRLCDVVDKHVA
ncbi:aldolase [Ochrobactrum teleogrylli]|uniref:Aldolase n=1 Tax=Ochrobactrum teleogrylli TaxID=2479765 RepID=A0ABD5K1X7_9HYPH